MAEFEELRLTATLVDNASQGLEQLRANVMALTQNEKAFEKLQKDIESVNSKLGRVREESSKTSAAIQTLTRTVAGAITTFATALISKFTFEGLKQFTDEVVRLNNSARAFGVQGAEMKSIVDQLKRWGIEASAAERYVTNLSAATDNLLRRGSAIRRELVEGAAMLGPENEQAMQAHLERFLELGRRGQLHAQGSLVNEFAERLRQIADDPNLDDNMRRRAAAQFRRYAEVFMQEPNVLAATRGRPLNPVTPEERKAWEDRSNLAEQFSLQMARSEENWNKIIARMQEAVVGPLKDLNDKFDELGATWGETIGKQVSKTISDFKSLLEEMEYWKRLLTDPINTIQETMHPALARKLGLPEPSPEVQDRRDRYWAEQRAMGRRTIWDEQLDPNQGQINPMGGIPGVAINPLIGPTGPLFMEYLKRSLGSRPPTPEHTPVPGWGDRPPGGGRIFRRNRRDGFQPTSFSGFDDLDMPGGSSHGFMRVDSSEGYERTSDTSGSIRIIRTGTFEALQDWTNWLKGGGSGTGGRGGGDGGAPDGIQRTSFGGGADRGTGGADRGSGVAAGPMGGLPSFRGAGAAGAGAGSYTPDGAVIPPDGGGRGAASGDLSRSAFDRMFAGTPLANQYDNVVASARRHGIPPALAASIMAHETGKGTSAMLRDRNNPGGMMDPRTGWRTGQSFPSVEAGVDASIANMARRWREGGENIPGMARIYAPVGAANDPKRQNRFWPGHVERYRQQLEEQGERGPGGSTVTGGMEPRGGGSRGFDYFQRRGDAPVRDPRQLATIDTPYGKVRVHPEAADDFKGFYDRLAEAGAPVQKVGSYNVRRKRWGSQWSSHSYAAAHDIDDAVQFSPAMRKWIQENPERWRQILRDSNVGQPRSLANPEKPWQGKDPAHIEWLGPRAPGTAGAPDRGPGSGAHPFLGARDRQSNADRNNIDRRLLDRGVGETRVTGSGHLRVDINAPKHARVDAEGKGLFRDVETNRSTQMEYASDGPKMPRTSRVRESEMVYE